MNQLDTPNPMTETGGKKTDNQSHVLVFCGNGYIFNEIYRPIVESLYKEFHFDVLMADYYLNGHTPRLVELFLREKKIDTYQVIESYLPDWSSFRYHRKMRDIVESLPWPKLSLLILGTDYDIFDRYLIAKARSQNVPVAIIQTGTIIRTLKRNLHKKDNFLDDTGKISRVGFLKKLLSKIWHEDIQRKIFILLHYYLFPQLVTKKSFGWFTQDDLHFTAGRADSVLCYDKKEKEAIEALVPAAKNVFVVRHPVAEGFCRCDKKNFNAPKRLLVSFGGCLETEMSPEALNRWVKVISQTVSVAQISEVHLRFHPRTSLECLWPKKMLDSIKKLGFEVKTIDSLEFSLPDHVCDYAVMLGSPSGALRVARAVCKDILVIGVPNCCGGGLDDQEWILGDAEGIVWLHNNEELGEKHLKIPKIDIENRLSPSQVISKLCRKLI